MNLYRKTAKGIKWSIISTIGNTLIQFVLGVILARLLLPKDYGLLGMSAVLVFVSKSIIDSGLYQALIQKKEVDVEDYSVVFKYNLFLSIILTSVIILSSKNIAHFYKNNQISNIVSVLSFVVFIESFSLIQRAKLIRNLRFDLIAKVEISVKLLSGCAAILLAIFGFSVWSLVFKELLYSLLTTLLYWIIIPTKISFKKSSVNKFKELFGFGYKIFIADQLESWSNQIAQMLIGKKYTPSDLGYYSKAYQLQGIFSQTIIVSINKVIFPSFSKIQDEDEKLKHFYKILIKSSMIFTLPVMFTGIIVANDLIPLIFGQNWIPMIPYFKLLCIGGIAYPLIIFNLNIIKIKGNARLYLLTCSISKGLLLPIIVLGLQFSVMGLVISLIIYNYLAAYINAYFSGRLINYHFREQFGDIFYFGILALILFGLIEGLKIYTLSCLAYPLLRICSYSLLMFSFYFSTLFVYKRADVLEIKNVLSKSK